MHRGGIVGRARRRVWSKARLKHDSGCVVRAARHIVGRIKKRIKTVRL
jgi:hypothetical protein